MKKTILLSIVLVSILTLSVYAESKGELKGFMVTRFPFYIYSDASYKMNHFITAGWMGDIRDITINSKATENSKSGKTCIKITYKAEEKYGANWAGLYFQQNPQNWWNSRRGGYDLTRAKRIYFYARGEKGKEVVEFKLARSKQKQYANVSKTTIKVRLTKDWKKYELDMTDMELKDIAGGFCFIVNNHDNPKGCTFYLDEIYYSDKAATPAITTSSKSTSQDSKY